MSSEKWWCPICGQRASELHHRIFKSQNKALEHCKLNHIYLCMEHHRGTQGVHGSRGHKLDNLLKLQFQNNLELLFDSEFLTEEDVSIALKMNERSVYRLTKTIKRIKGKFDREDLIIALMGGKKVSDG